jgi:hypothetical protein
MGGRTLKALFLATLAREVLASCAYGTHLQPRAEGQVKVNTFGYTGQIVRFSTLPFEKMDRFS